MYKPTDADILWTRNLVRSIANGGEWTWPSANLRMRFDHKKKEVIVQNQNNENMEDIEMASANFEATGYKVVFNTGVITEPVKVDTVIVDLIGNQPMILGWNQEEEKG